MDVTGNTSLLVNYKPISKNMAQLKLKKEEVVFKQGETADCLYYIREGRIAIVKEIPDRNNSKRQVTMNVLKKGDIFGELALFKQNSERSASAIVISDTCMIDRVTRDDFFSDLGHTTEFINELFRQLAQRFLEKEETMYEEFASDDFLSLCYIINMFRNRRIDYNKLIQTASAILEIKKPEVEDLLHNIRQAGLIRMVASTQELDQKKQSHENQYIEIVGFKKSFMIAARKIAAGGRPIDLSQKPLKIKDIPQ